MCSFVWFDVWCKSTITIEPNNWYLLESKRYVDPLKDNKKVLVFYRHEESGVGVCSRYSTAVEIFKVLNEFDSSDDPNANLLCAILNVIHEDIEFHELLPKICVRSFADFQRVLEILATGKVKHITKQFQTPTHIDHILNELIWFIDKFSHITNFNYMGFIAIHGRKHYRMVVIRQLAKIFALHLNLVSLLDTIKPFPKIISLEFALLTRNTTVLQLYPYLVYATAEDYKEVHMQFLEFELEVLRYKEFYLTGNTNDMISDEEIEEHKNKFYERCAKEEQEALDTLYQHFAINSLGSVVVQILSLNM